MLAQLDRLLGLTGMPHIKLGIIPFGVLLPTAPQNSFVLFDDDLAVVETFVGENMYHGDEASAYARAMDDLLAEAYFDAAARQPRNGISQSIAPRVSNGIDSGTGERAALRLPTRLPPPDLPALTSGQTEGVAGVEEFERERGRLFGLAYRMLGSAADAEDVVQDAFLRWQGTAPGAVEAPAAWLVKVTTNLCLNRLGSARSWRERYVGARLPEPVLTSDGALGPMETAEQRAMVSLAFLVLAERLTPDERAVFVLREAFGYSHREVAELVELSEPNCRQLHRRARKRLADAKLPSSSGNIAEHRALIERFLDAARGGDLAGLERMLAEDVTSVADGGGTPGVARLPVHGAEKVARYLATVTGRYVEGLMVSIREVNGIPGVLGWFGSTLLGVFVPEIAGGRITGIRIVANPEKLRFVSEQVARLSHSGESSGS